MSDYAVYTYSATHLCLGCGGLGDPHWVDMCEKSLTYGLCTECRCPPKEAVSRDGMDRGAGADRTRGTFS